MPKLHRITGIVATQVVVPVREGYCDRPAFGAPLFDKTPKWIIELSTNQGLTGYGEALRGASLGEIQWSAKQILGKELLSLSWRQPVPIDWSGNDALGHANPPVPHRFYELDRPMTPGAVGMTVAITDLLGKAAGTPAVNLFGGAHRQWVPTSFWTGRTDPEHAARQMETALKLGYTGMKIKAALEDDVVGTVRAIKRVAGPAAPIVIDPNMRFYRFSEAIVVARELEEHRHVMLEDPFPYDPEEWRLFRQKTCVPLVNHYAAPTVRALADRACDHVSASPPAGRLLGTAYLAQQFGAHCWATSGIELGILDAYSLHAAAAAQNAVLPGDAVGHDLRVDDLVVETFQTRDGATRLPEGPGLGVTLDHTAVQRFAIARWESTV